MKKYFLVIGITALLAVLISSSKGMVNPINILHCSEIWSVQYKGSMDGKIQIYCNIGGVYKCPYCSY